MKEYKFERIQLKGIPGLYIKSKQNYQDIIRLNAQQGWELVQIFSPPTSLYGGAPYFELIFCREN